MATQPRISKGCRNRRTYIASTELMRAITATTVAAGFGIAFAFVIAVLDVVSMSAVTLAGVSRSPSFATTCT